MKYRVLGRTGVRVSQAVVDDETFTRLRIAREKFRQASYTEQIARFDTVQETAQAYLQLLSAIASLRVTEEDARVTRHNLELARLGITHDEAVVAIYTEHAQVAPG